VLVVNHPWELTALRRLRRLPRPTRDARRAGLPDRGREQGQAMTTLIAVYTSDGCAGRCDARCYNAAEAACECAPKGDDGR